MPCPVGLRSISDTRALPVLSITAPQRQTSEPSTLNFTPYAVLPSGFSSLLAHSSHACSSSAFASLCSTTGVHQPSRSRAKSSGASCSSSASIVDIRIRLPRAGFVSAQRSRSAMSPTSSTLNSDHAVFCVSPLLALSLMPLKTTPGAVGSGGVPR